MRLVGVGSVIAAVLVLGGSAWASAEDPAGSRTSPAWNRETPAEEPVHLIVSVPEQKVDVFVGGRLVATSPVSTGRKGYATPTGVFSILQKRRYHRSNIYSRAPMPFMQRLTWSGVALHASNQVPGYPASHGCVRLPSEFARKLFGFTGIGTHVIISGSETTLAEIRHPKLFQPFPDRRPAATQARSQRRTTGTPSVEVASAEAIQPHDVGAEMQLTSGETRNDPPVRILVTRRTGREHVRDVQTLLKELGHDPGELDGWMGKDTSGAIIRFQESRGLPTTGAMSEELVEDLYRAAGKGKPPTGRLYVRREFAPVFDVPITISEPEKPLGSHLFTAMAADIDGGEVRWLAVTLNESAPDEAAPEDERAKAETIPSAAREALDRIEIPIGVRRWISKMLVPGSSLAISDDGISRETHDNGTDFVVLTR